MGSCQRAGGSHLAAELAPRDSLRLKRPNGKERTTVVETDTFHEVNYVRKEIIHADGGVSFDSAYDKINRDIIVKMQKLIT